MKVIPVIAMILLQCVLCSSGAYAGVRWIPLAQMQGAMVNDMELANASTVYVASNHGVYKSTDFGANWVSINRGLGTPAPFVEVIAVGPGALLHIRTTTGQFYRSTDAGKNWVLMNNAAPFFRDLAMSGGTLYGASGNRVFVSADGGRTWAPRNTGLQGLGFATSIEAVPNGPVYLASQSSILTTPLARQSAIFKWTGSTWTRGVCTEWRNFTQPGGGVVSKCYTPDIVRVVASGPGPVAYSTVYAGGISGLTGTPEVFASTDKGITWATTIGAIGSSGQMTAFGVDATGKHMMVGMLKSGVTSKLWSPVRYSNNGAGGPWIGSLGLSRWGGFVNVTRLHTTGLATYYAGTAHNGVFTSTNFGASWRASSKGMTYFPAVFAIAVDPAQPSTIYASGSWGAGSGVLKSTDGGVSWNPTAGVFDKFFNQQIGGGPILIDPRNSNILYASGNGGGLWKSADAGISWSKISTGLVDNLGNPARISVLAMRKSTGTLFAGCDGGCTLFTSVNGGGSWTHVGAMPLNGFVSDIEIDQRSTGIVYVTTDLGVFKSTNNGISWTAMNNGLGSKRVNTLAISPRDSRRLYAGTALGLYVSTNAGASWQLVNSGVPTNISILDVTFSTVNPNIGYVRAWGGSKVYKSTDGGATWFSIDASGISGHALTRITIDPSNADTVYLGTLNNGVFKAVLTPPIKPANARAKAMDSKTVALKWQDQSIDENGFMIYRQQGKRAKIQIGQVVANITSYVDRTAKPGKSYRYFVAAFNAAGTSTLSVSSVRTLKAPLLRTAKPSRARKPVVVLKYRDVSRGERAFVIQRKQKGSVWKTVGKARANSRMFTDRRGLKKGVRYIYRIKAIAARSSSDWSRRKAVRIR